MEISSVHAALPSLVVLLVPFLMLSSCNFCGTSSLFSLSSLPLVYSLCLICCKSFHFPLFKNVQEPNKYCWYFKVGLKFIIHNFAWLWNSYDALQHFILVLWLPFFCLSPIPHIHTLLWGKHLVFLAFILFQCSVLSICYTLWCKFLETITWHNLISFLKLPFLPILCSRVFKMFHLPFSHFLHNCCRTHYGECDSSAVSSAEILRSWLLSPAFRIHCRAYMAWLFGCHL